MNVLRKKGILILLAIFTAFSFSFAEEFLTVSSFIGDVEYKIGEGEWEFVNLDSEIPESAMVRVNNSDGFISLRLSDGSEVKLYGLTSVSVGDLLSEQEGSKKTFFELLAGKLFASVKKTGDQDFQVETEAAVAAVRGTEFAAEYQGGEGSGEITVFDGEVEVSDPKGINPPVTLTKGQKSTFTRDSGPSEPVQATEEDYEEFGQTYEAPAAETVEEEVEVPAAEPAVTEPVETIDENEPVETETSEAPDAGKVEASAPESASEDTEDSSSSTEPSIDDVKDDMADSLLEDSSSDECSTSGFKWSIASETIGGNVWKKVLLAPTIKLEGFTLSLYLPFYFQNLDDLLPKNWTRWYNYWDDWNFGTGGASFDWKDSLHDLMMKIRYMKVKTDKVLFQLGNIPSMTIGHGILVYNYANDLQFPAERKLGIQFNLDTGVFGFEMMAGDLFMTKLFATKLFVRPFPNTFLIKNMSFGISGFIDQEPLGTDGNIDPHQVFGYAFDFDMPILDLGAVFGTTLFFDIGTLGYNNSNTNDYFIGYGYSAGFLGNILMIDYRIEFKSINNGFIDNYVDSLYDAKRTERYQDLITRDEQVESYNGFVITAGHEFESIGAIELSFEQLFPAGLEELGLNITNVDPNNSLHFEISIDKCLFKKAYGTIAYDRNDFYVKDFFKNMLENATLSANIYYGITEQAYIGINYKRFYDENGNAEDTYGIETQFGL